VPVDCVPFLPSAYSGPIQPAGQLTRQIRQRKRTFDAAVAISPSGYQITLQDRASGATMARPAMPARRFRGAESNGTIIHQ
jgi:hypothetical protein